MTISNARIRAEISAKETGGLDWSSEFEPNVKAILDLTNGTGADQADMLFADEREVASGSNDDLDLAGALSGAFGDTLTFAEIVALIVVNAPKSGAANTTDLTIGGATNAVDGFLGGTSPTIGPIKPGGVALLAAGAAAGLGSITAGSTDELRIANSAGAAATYQILILGRSA